MTVILLFNGCAKDNDHKAGQDGNMKNLSSLSTNPIQEQLNKMTLNEKIGQMIIAGFDGTTVDISARDLINKYKLGGLIVYQPNVKDAAQLASLTNWIKIANTRNKIPLFISVDQEGGRVNRMPSSIINTPSARTIGHTNSEQYAYNIGNIIAKELAAFGFNTDFAPVLDIQSNPNNTVIGDRSFGSTPSLVSKLGVSMMKGISAGQIIPVVKHFPGHGDTSIDSHLELPVVTNDLSRLKSFELIPFSNAFKNGADMVMVAHILMQKLDSKYPASMSQTVITDLLREQLGFWGVVITDDMTMGAIVKHYTLEAAVVRSVNAGSNIILVGHGKDNVAAVYNSLYAAVTNRTISEDSINKSVYRILALKHKYNINNNEVSPVNVNNVNSLIKKAISGQ